MSQVCSQCGHPNPAGSTFCIRCGGKLGVGQTFQQFASSNPDSSAYSVGYQAQGAQAQSAAIFSSAPVQMGSVSSSPEGQSMPHAFAGRGSLITHLSWLLSGDSANAANLRDAILEILRPRHFLHLNLNIQRLQESGHWIEERDYIIMKRGVATVFVYVAPAGQDLYISRATTVQLSIDPLRVIILCCALAEVFLSPGIIGGILTSTASSGLSNPGGLAVPLIIALGLILLYIPAITFLFSFLVVSFKHWLVERDFWIYLRRNDLHDFEIDDVDLLEHATDEATRAAVKQLNLDATKIVSPSNYHTKRHVRAI
jgi:hypothetical protein